MSLFDELRSVDVNDHKEKKGKFDYLSWAWAWEELKTHCPDATFEKHEYDHAGITLPYMLDPNGYAFVKVSVTANGETHADTYPVTNHSNKPIQNPNSFDVNTALQRCLVKAIAYFGLGLYIYAGEDLPPAETLDRKGLTEKYAAELTELEKHLADEAYIAAEELWHTIPEAHRNELHQGAPKNAYGNWGPLTSKVKQGLKDAEAAHFEHCRQIAEQMAEMEDKTELKEAADELTELETTRVRTLLHDIYEKRRAA